jgi:hypothetical protein
MTLPRFALTCVVAPVAAVGIWSFTEINIAALGGATAQIQFVEPVLRPLPSGTGTIVGQVLINTGQPASGAKVSLRAQAYQSPDYDPPAYQVREAVADALGRFEFSGVPYETLDLAASMPGFLEALYGQARPGLPGTPIRLNANQRVSVVLRLSRGSSISGTVFDTRGNPASGISVYAPRQRPWSDGETLNVEGGNAVTDDAGRYRVSDLPPGRYIVMGHRVWPNYERPPLVSIGPNEVGFESGAMYRDARDANSADQIDLGLGQELGGIDLRLHLESVTTVGGVVRNADGQPSGRAHLRLVLPHDPEPPALETTAAPDGSFEFTRVPAGDFEIVAYSTQAEAREHGRLPVTIDGRTPIRVGLDLRPGATVSGRVVFASRPTPPPAARFTFFLASAFIGMHYDVRGVVGEISSPAFTYRGVPPGRYVITINRESLPPEWRMQSEMVDGRDALDFPFEITADEHRDVLITLSDQRTELSGIVTNAKGAPGVDYTVVVFAADDRFWIPRPRRVETVRPDINGRYRVLDLPAGEYVVALADPDLYGRPPSSLLKQLRPISGRVTLRDGEKKAYDVRAGSSFESSASVAR